MKRFYYLTTLIFVFCIPAAASYFFLKEHVSIGALIPFIVLITIMGSIWDVWATRHSKKDRVWLWQFNHSDTLGIKFLGLPIEEYLLYVTSGTYVVFMWEGMKLIRNQGLTEAYIMVGGMAVWTFISITIPYIFSPKGDRLIN